MIFNITKVDDYFWARWKGIYEFIFVWFDELWIHWKSSNFEKKNGRYSGIDVALFRGNLRVSKATDAATGESVMVKKLTVMNQGEWEAAKEEKSTLEALGKCLSRFQFVNEVQSIHISFDMWTSSTESLRKAPSCRCASLWWSTAAEEAL